mmetsp:Transcript_16066/g.57133  ORF Transcript_16066/g.57133 Transcript_16066/m.57133 type:complete len:239 (-) Transcript_16066:897-1613(-)
MARMTTERLSATATRPRASVSNMRGTTRPRATKACSCRAEAPRAPSPGDCASKRAGDDKAGDAAEDLGGTRTTPPFAAGMAAHFRPFFAAAQGAKLPKSATCRVACWHSFAKSPPSTCASAAAVRRTLNCTADRCVAESLPRAFVVKAPYPWSTLKRVSEEKPSAGFAKSAKETGPATQAHRGAAAKRAAAFRAAPLEENEWSCLRRRCGAPSSAVGGSSSSRPPRAPQSQKNEDLRA